MNRVKCILLIDDDETNNFINELLIMEMDITEELLIVQNGQEGIDLLNKRIKDQMSLPEIILLDVNMPVMDGFDFLDEYHQQNFPSCPHVRIIMLTTSLNPKDIANAKESGIYDYVNKPLSHSILQGLVDNYQA